MHTNISKLFFSMHRIQETCEWIISACVFYVYAVVLYKVALRDLEIYEARFRQILLPLFSIQTACLTLTYQSGKTNFHVILGAFVALSTALWTYRNIIQGVLLLEASDIKEMKDKVVIITGANSGIGFQTAKQLLEMEAIVILACRSKERAMAAMSSLAQQVPKSATRMKFLKLDLADLESVREFSKEFKELKMPLHVIINNAGLLRSNRT